MHAPSYQHAVPVHTSLIGLIPASHPHFQIKAAVDLSALTLAIGDQYCVSGNEAVIEVIV